MGVVMSPLHRRLIQWALAVVLGMPATACNPDTPVDRNHPEAGADFEVPPAEVGTNATDAGADGDS
jgi:hypothetical protein